LNKFKIAETDTFSSKVADSKYSKIYKKISDYVYPQLRENPFFGTNIKKLKGEFEGYIDTELAIIEYSIKLKMIRF